MTNELLNVCEKYKHIYIYGAGKNAKRIYEYLESNSMHTEGFIVTQSKDNEKVFLGKPVVILKNHKQNEDELILCSIVHGTKYYFEVVDIISRSLLRNVLFLSRRMFAQVVKWEQEMHLKHEMQVLQSKFLYDHYFLSERRKYHTIFGICMNNYKYFWRMNNDQLANIRNIGDFFSTRSALEEHIGQYGAYHLLDDSRDVEGIARPDAGIYMARHHLDHPIAEMPPSYFIPIQVGAVGADVRICDVTDDTGDNISEKNDIYSECTAIYWMWKNVYHKNYIGVCHYRRQLKLPGDDTRFLVAHDVDILVSYPTYVIHNLKLFFSFFLPQSDIEIFLDTIKCLHPEYLQDAKAFFQSRSFSTCNVFIMRYEIFQQYAPFAFDILFAVEERLNYFNRMRHDRYAGYLMECLLAIFLMHHKDKYRIFYADMSFLT